MGSGLKTAARSALWRLGYHVEKLPKENRGKHEELSQIPGVDPVELLGDAKPRICLTIQKYEDGMLPLNDAVALLSILVMENPREVLEIGTFMGHTTRAMAETLETATINTLDLPPDFSAAQDPNKLLPKDDFHLIGRRILGREFKDRDCRKRIVQHLGDSAKFDFQKIGRPTFFFIDGSHTYEYCKSDSEKCLALCPKGGTFFWHDCDIQHPGVVRFVREWRQAGRNIVRLNGTALAYWKDA
jgi:Methyltransferase domain